MGSYVPEPVVTNEALRHLGHDPDWILRRTGIRERRHAPPEQATSDLAWEAARRCLEMAQVAPAELDLILVATVTPDTQMPSTACHLQRMLGATAPALDLSAACAGFMYGLATGAQFVATGQSQRVLLVGADIMSRVVNPRDANTYPLFGDGAGAALLTAGSSEQGLVRYALGADGGGGELLVVPGGGTRQPFSQAVLDRHDYYLCMEGRAVFKWAVRLLTEAVRTTLAAAQLDPRQLAAVVLHQANNRILTAAVEHLEIDPAKVLINLDRYGNTSAASIPLALDEALQAGRIQRGDYVLLCGFGAGLTWGSALVRW